MKKIFTLFAIATMAVSAQAQETVLFTYDGTYTDLQELTTENTKLVLGQDIKKASKWDNKAASSSEYLAAFTQTVQIKNDDTGEMEDKDRIVYISGGNNPKDDTANKGGGFSGATEQGNLPQSGTYYMITPKKDGSILAGIVLNADKEFFIVDGTDAVKDEETGALLVNNATANITHDNYVIKNSDGTVMAYTDVAPTDGNGIFDGGKGGVKVVEKIPAGTVEFNVLANHTYYIFCTGSKLGFFGYVFTAGGSAGITAAKTVSKDNAIYNLAGQKVVAGYKGIVIKNGQKVVMK